MLTLPVESLVQRFIRKCQMKLGFLGLGMFFNRHKNIRIRGMARIRWCGPLGFCSDWVASLLLRLVYTLQKMATKSPKSHFRTASTQSLVSVITHKTSA